MSDLTLKIIANIVSFLATLVYCYGRFKKDKTNVLTYALISKVLLVLTYVIMGTISAAYAFLIHIPSTIFAKIKVDKNKKWHSLYILFQLCYILIAIFNFKVDGWVAILVCIGSTISLISIWYLSPQLMRIVSLPNSAIYIVFYIMSLNYVGAISEILVVLSNISSYIKYRKLKE